MDIASLGLELKSDQIAKGTDRLRAFEGQSKRTEGATAHLNRTLRSLATAAMAAVGASLSVVGYIKLADAWSDMRSQLGAATKDMAGAGDMMMRMVDIANASYAPLDQTVQIYSRNVGVLRELGYNAAQAADFTEGLNHALVITATKGERAASVQNALAKAMAVGKLQADGLETVLANGGRLAEAFADELGTTVNGLRQMASEGRITGKVITDAILNNLEKLRAEAAEMPATVADGFQRIRTGLQALIGVFDQTTGSTGALAGALVAVGDALASAAQWAQDNGEIIRDVFNTVIGTAIVAVAALVVKFGATWVGTMVASAGATGLLSGALVILQKAILATGIGALVIGAGFLIGKFLALAESVGGFGNAMEYVLELGVEVWERLRLGGSALVEGFRAYTAAFVLLWQEAFSTVTGLFAKFADEILSGMQATFRGLGAPGLAMVAGIEAARGSIRDMARDADAAAKANVEAQRAVVEGHMQTATQMAKDAIKPLEMWGAINDVIEAAKANAAAADVGPVTAAGNLPDDLTGGGVDGLGVDDGAMKAAQSFIDSLRTEIDQLLYSAAELRQMAVDSAWAAAPTQELADMILMLGQEREAALRAAEARDQLNTARGILDNLQFEIEALQMSNEERARATALRDLERQGIVQGTEAWNQYGQAILDAAGALATANDNTRSTMEEAARGLSMLSRGFGDLASVMKDSVGEQSAVYKTLFAAQHAFAIASSMASIQTAMAQALTLPPPANFMYMGIVAAEGASIIASIQALAGSFADGGYTGAGGKYDVAGLVHKGEVVWSQKDVARYGGWQNVDALRRGIMPAANDNGGGAGGVLHIKVTVDDEGHWAAYVNDAVGQGVNAAVTISDQRSKARMDSMQSEARRPVISARGAA